MEKPSAYQGDEPYFFVCYAHEDAETVYPEIAWLQAEGVNVWYDEGISLGTEWTEALADAIEGCTKFLFFVTPNSVTREHCRRELNFAQEEGRDVMAVHLEPTEVTGGLRLSLNNRQAIFKHDLAEPQYRQALLNAVGGPSAEQPPKPETQTSSTSPRWAIYAAAALLIVVAGALLLRAPEEPPPAEFNDEAESVAEPVSAVLHNSIAVLPFDNISPDPDDAYFAAGIHDEILSQLAKIKDLSVIARTTMLRYADSDKSVPEIGAELNVGTVMEGSVRYAGDRVRITTQLIDATSGAQLWSEAHEEDLEDIFGIQLAIASRIADSLEAEFSLTEQARIAKRSTDNAEAYAHYLRALNSWGKAPPAEIHKELDAAIALDPEFAPALAFNALVFALERHPLVAGSSLTPESERRSVALAEEYARRALAVDDTQARAHFALLAADLFNWRWDAADRGFERIYSLDPNDYIAVSSVGTVRMQQGDIDAGIKLVERSIELSPADANNVASFANTLYQVERWEAAKQQANLVISMVPDFAVGYAILAKVNSRLGDEDGVRQNAALAEAHNPSTYEFPDIALAYGQIGDLVAAKRIFDLVGAGDESVVPDLRWQFWMHMAIKDYQAALGYLERSINENFPSGTASGLYNSSDHPDLDPIRSYPTFGELVQRVSMPRDSAG